MTQQEDDLRSVSIPLEFSMKSTAVVHGLAFWFDAAYIGSENTCWLSTAPTAPLTHW